MIDRARSFSASRAMFAKCFSERCSRQVSLPKIRSVRPPGVRSVKVLRLLRLNWALRPDSCPEATQYVESILRCRMPPISNVRAQLVCNHGSLCSLSSHRRRSPVLETRADCFACRGFKSTTMSMSCGSAEIRLTDAPANQPTIA